jgi:hypothetical protein
VNFEEIDPAAIGKNIFGMLGLEPGARSKAGHSHGFPS